MKKLLLILPIALILLASCEKDYVCRCTVTTTSKQIDSVTIKDVTDMEVYELHIKSTKKAVKRGECSNYHKESSKDGYPITTDRKCTINTQ